ncbi:MAG: DUF2460 domain-containing protein [Rhodobacteraceae bacterium]|nr:DUF2460 domain-containing protein [Paracoccaceae bacterium]
MSFHEVRFPASLSIGAVGGPERRTQIVALASGAEERNTPWMHSRRRYDAGLGLRNLDDVETVVAFFEARQGQLHGFRWKDWADYKSCLASRPVHHLDQVIGTGNGVATTFALTKAYASGEQVYLRPIAKIVQGTVRVGVGGDVRLAEGDYTVDHNLGTITFAFPPDTGLTITAGFEFDVPVRFDTDAIKVSVSSFNAGEVPSIPVVEVRI